MLFHAMNLSKTLNVKNRAAYPKISGDFALLGLCFYKDTVN